MTHLEERDYNVRLLDLPPAVKGLVKRTDDYCTIILNSRHTWEQNRSSYKHETDHLENNDYEQNYADAIEANRKGVKL